MKEKEMLWNHVDEYAARQILWRATMRCESKRGLRILLSALRYLESSRPKEFSSFIPLGAN